MDNESATGGFNGSAPESYSSRVLSSHTLRTKSQSESSNDSRETPLPLLVSLVPATRRRVPSRAFASSRRARSAGARVHFANTVTLFTFARPTWQYAPHASRANSANARAHTTHALCILCAPHERCARTVAEEGQDVGPEQRAKEDEDEDDDCL